MIITTTNTLQDKQITAYHGIVTGTCIMGANVFRDLFAGDKAMGMRANAIIGVDIDYETVGGSMLMVAVSGTAVTVL